MDGRLLRGVTVATLAGAVLWWGTAAFPIAQTATAPRSDAKPVRLNGLIEKLEQGRTVVGTFPGAQSGSLAGARALGASTNDFVMFDLQYGVFDVGPIQLSLLGMTNKSALVQRGNLQVVPTPLARIPESTHDNPMFAAKQLLDIGMFGIMFPHIESKEQAEQAVRAMRYPQRAGVSFDPADSVRGAPADAFWYWGLSKDEYMRRADVWPLHPDGELLAVLQIESSAGVQHRDEIMSVPGVGVIFLGPSHLSQSLGEKSANSPRTEEAVQTVLKTCLLKRVPCAYPVVAETAEAGRAELARRQVEGFRMLTVNVNRR